ncbi:hypothetical protein [Methylobacterium trifolii]|nr:hypothetical protein [Methylobacterium trifolii]
MATTNVTSAGGATLYSMTVAAQATMTSSLMKMWVNAVPVKVTATAQNPTISITFTLSSFASNAADADAIYYYTVPSDGSVPSSASLTLLYTNTSSTSGKTVTAVVTAGQKIGFALKNVTGGITPYLLNGYLGLQGTTHWFYSHLMPPSKQSYSWISQNCNLQAIASDTGEAVKNGACFSTLPSYATINCSQSPGKTITYYWNDMGGLVDDKDYNDAVFKVSCSGKPGSGQ